MRQEQQRNLEAILRQQRGTAGQDTAESQDPGPAAVFLGTTPPNTATPARGPVRSEDDKPEGGCGSGEGDVVVLVDGDNSANILRFVQQCVRSSKRCVWLRGTPVPTLCQNHLVT